MKLLVSESGDHLKAAEHQVLTTTRRTISRVRNLFLRSPTVANLQPRAPATTSDSFPNFAPLLIPLTGDDQVLTAAQQQGAAGISEDVVTAVPEQKVKEAVEVDAIELVFSTQNLRTLRQRINVFYNKEDRGNEEQETSHPTKQLRRHAPVDASSLRIATNSASLFCTSST